MDVQEIREKVFEVLGSDFPQREPVAAGIIFALLEQNDALHKQVASLEQKVKALEEENLFLKQRVRELEMRLNMDSHNSSKPPSSDGYRKPPAPKSLRKSSGRRPGGQPGHKGSTLEMSMEPDYVVEHVVDRCASCGHSLVDVAAQTVRKHQVFDIPRISMEVTEHQLPVKACPCCGTRTAAEPPPQAQASVQYGSGIKSLVTVLMNYQFIPYERLGEFFRDLLGHSISPGTFNNILGQCYEGLENFEEIVKKDITASPVSCFDETGLRSGGSLLWLHSASTRSLTHYHIDSKRGAEGMKSAGILPEFGGIAVHDGWKQYMTFPCSHALCNAHHLRELTGAFEDEGKQWASRLKDFLVEVKDAVDLEKACGKERLDAAEVKGYEKRFEEILQAGYTEYPEHLPEDVPARKRGRAKRPRSLNLLDRLWYGMNEVLAFMRDFRVPFDNNLSERDLRMMKVKQKISGAFRSTTCAEWFCRIRGYLSTVRKNGCNVLQAVNDVFLGKPFMPKGSWGTE